jgi:hypothetical protein
MARGPVSTSRGAIQTPEHTSGKLKNMTHLCTRPRAGPTGVTALEAHLYAAISRLRCAPGTQRKRRSVNLVHAQTQNQRLGPTEYR